jgi:putative ABC transport system permease protein
VSVKTKKVFRDIKERRYQFIAIIVILILGASMYFGLLMVNTWRKESLTTSYDELLWEDMQIDLLHGTYVNESIIQNTIKNISDYNQINAIEYRLVLNTACNLSNQDKFTIIPNKIIGINVSNAQLKDQMSFQAVNNPSIRTGRYFKSNEVNDAIAIVDHRLFKHYQVNVGGNISLLTPTGSLKVEIIGSVTFPEYIILLDENAMGIFSEKQYTVIESPLKMVQNYFYLPNQINQVVLRIGNQSSLIKIKHQIQTELADNGIEAKITLGTDHPVYKMQFEDIKNDNLLFMLIAILFLISGGFGSYVTINRLATAQKREIGIALAIGYQPRAIIRNYLLFPFIITSISSLGTILLGNFIAESFWNSMIDILGYPCHLTNRNYKLLAEALILVLIIPMISTFLAVWQISRNLPVKLIRFDPRTSQATTKRSIIEKTFLYFFNISISLKISIRNVFRNKKRTLSTLSGVIMSLCLMGIIWGLIDTIDLGLISAENDIGNWSVRFETTTFIPENVWSEKLETMKENNVLIEYQLGLQMPVRFPDYHDEENDKLVNFLEGLVNDNDIRTINVVEGKLEEGAIVLSKPTAKKLNINIGENIKIEHISIGGNSGYSLVNSSIKVSGIHDQLFGSYCFMKLSSIQDLCNSSGLVNSGYAIFGESSEEEIMKDLYSDLYGLNKIINRDSMINETKEIFVIFQTVFLFAQMFCMILALALIYNSVSSNIQERRREIGTMRTLGTPKKAVLRYLLIENSIMVILGLILGIFIGDLFIDSFLQEIINGTFPHLYLPTVISLNSWFIISGSVIFVLLITHISVLFFLRNLNLAAATKVRE